MNLLGRIVQLRNERGWTEYQLAKKSGIEQSTISSWYCRQLQPTINSLEKICMGFQISVSEFFAVGNEPVSLTCEQKKLLDSWSRLSKEQKTNLLAFLEQL